MVMKKRLIDANAIKYREHRGGGGREYPENIATEDEIAKLPTVDAVEVVRCKDCKHYEPGFIRPYCGWCEEWNTAVRASGFCHRGERKDE